MTKRKINIPIIIGMSIAIGILIGTTLNFKNKSVLFSSNANEAKIKKLINYIHYDYVDKVDTDSLLDMAISDMVLKLDPHSVYIPKEELQQVTENMQGKFVGIGVTFLMHQDSVAITGVVKNGPSEKAGILAGDRIIMAENDTLYGDGLKRLAGVNPRSRGGRYNAKINNTVMASLKGQPETKVNVKVYRRATDEILSIPITRGDVTVKSVTAYYMIKENLGYIKVERFARTTFVEFKTALLVLKRKGMTGLVLDLRGNLGGYMHVANDIIDEFLEDGKLIVFTKNKNGEVDRTYATKRGDFEDGKVYVLIDQNSASASEIVAGALQDNDIGTIIGRRSFGKGLVQQDMDLGDGSAVRLTTSRYYTPTGRSIQKPYENGAPREYNKESFERAHSGELFSKDSIKVVDSLKFTTPGGKVVYGGGGIIPDVFVPIDTINSSSYRLLTRINPFVFKYIDNHREAMNEWTLEEFVESFDSDNRILNQYIDELDLKYPLAPKAKENLKRLFNAVMARDLFDQTGYYMITHKKDNMIQKVLELENNSTSTNSQ